VVRSPTCPVGTLTSSPALLEGVQAGIQSGFFQL